MCHLVAATLTEPVIATPSPRATTHALPETGQTENQTGGDQAEVTMAMSTCFHVLILFL